ncbi:type I restriction enzyme S subunit [Arcicella aurantiaca]|uniref:Type I restriction enzyme S subunit n=1 Tax=Arcicella aurantiaca TaxID=591202 RepID=A0A316EEX0_9BACT|nr:restriction endonuclease subunit S [Arcicella aurantiaca]PWK28222.1 type I restriction enzyme S subunit [Arcicella aurantiaca]
MKDNWVKVQLSNLVECLDGQRIPIKKEIRELIKGSIPYYGASGIIDFVNDYIFDEELILLGEDGENVISRNLPLAFKISGKNWVNNHAHVLRAKHGYDTDFLVYLLENRDYTDIVSGSAQPKINQNNLMKLVFNVPESLQKQQKIAKILSTCDEVIEKTEAAIAKYKAIKQGMMHDLFTRGIDVSTGKLRPSYQEAQELYKESELGMIPKEWEVSTFGRYTTHNLYGPRFSANDYHIDGNVKTIRGTDFTKDGNILYDQAPVAMLDKSKILPHILKSGDIVMITTADCGLTAVFEEQDIDFISSAYAVKYRFNEHINPYFIKYLMQTESLLKQVNKCIRQGTLGNLPGSDVLKFLFCKPELDEQIEIVERFKSLFQKLQAEESSLSKYKKLKEGLMQDLLTGKVEVSE